MRHLLLLTLFSACTAPRLSSLRTTFALLDGIDLTGFRLDLACADASDSITGDIIIDGDTYVVETRTRVCFGKDTTLKLTLFKDGVAAVTGSASVILGSREIEILFQSRRVGELSLSGDGTCTVNGAEITLPATLTLPIGDVMLTCQSNGRTVDLTARITTGDRTELDVSAPVTPGAPVRLRVDGPPSVATAGVPLMPFTVSLVDENGLVVPSDGANVEIIGFDEDVVGVAPLITGVAAMTSVMLTNALSTDLYARVQLGDARYLSDIFVVEVVAGSPARLLLVGPAQVARGVVTSYDVSVLDQFYNLSKVSLSVDVVSAPTTITGAASVALVDGVGTYALSFDVVGQYVLTVSDGAAGHSTMLEVTVLSETQVVSFEILAEQNPVVAGESLRLDMRALNASHQLVTEYGTDAVEVQSNDVRRPSLGYATFSDGIAVFNTSLETAGIITVIASEATAVGSIDIEVLAGAATTFAVDAPTMVTACSSFRLHVFPVDDYGNFSPSPNLALLVRGGNPGTINGVGEIDQMMQQPQHAAQPDRAVPARHGRLDVGSRCRGDRSEHGDRDQRRVQLQHLGSEPDVQHDHLRLAGFFGLGRRSGDAVSRDRSAAHRKRLAANARNLQLEHRHGVVVDLWTDGRSTVWGTCRGPRWGRAHRDGERRGAAAVISLF